MNLLSVADTAIHLKVSKSWVYRHLSQLPVTRINRLIRIDCDAIDSSVNIESGKSLKPGRRMANRYQRGGVRLRGSVWYGYFRIDSPKGRKAKEVRIGTKPELPTKTEARKKLTELMNHQDNPPATANEPTDEPLTFTAVATMWQKSEGPGMGENSLKHYTNALRAYVLPILGGRALDSIQREDVTGLLNAQASKYSRPALKSMRLVTTFVLSWAERNDKMKRPAGWLDGIKVPRKCGGRKVLRTEIEPQHALAIIQKLPEPYATLVLFLVLSGR